MSDQQPAATDIVIHELARRFAVGRFGAASSQMMCGTYERALEIAERYARPVAVDIWYSDTETAWRVRRYRPTGA